MSSGAKRMVQGSLVGPGTARDIETVGFRPTRVEVRNITATTGLILGYWQETMPDASMFLTILDGTNTFETSDGITPLAKGFTLGANADLNAATEELHWCAWD